MKFGTAIMMCAATAIGTAYALDKFTGGAVRETAMDMMIEHGLMDDDFDDFDDEESFDNFENSDDSKNFHVSSDENTLDDDIIVFHKEGTEDPSVVTMPIKDATNLYEMIEDAVGRLSKSESDIEAFGDKAISFERLYDALEEAGVVGSNKDNESKTDNNQYIITGNQNMPTLINDFDDPSVCGHSEENYGAEDPSKLDPDSSNYEITSKDSF